MSLRRRRLALRSWKPGIKEIDETMVLPDVCTNVAECTKLSREKAAIAEELEGLI